MRFRRGLTEPEPIQTHCLNRTNLSFFKMGIWGATSKLTPHRWTKKIQWSNSTSNHRHLPSLKNPLSRRRSQSIAKIVVELALAILKQRATLIETSNMPSTFQNWTRSSVISLNTSSQSSNHKGMLGQESENYNWMSQTQIIIHS